MLYPREIRVTTKVLEYETGPEVITFFSFVESGNGDKKSSTAKPLRDNCPEAVIKIKSTEFAKKFGKRHDDLLKKCRELESYNPGAFILTEYTNSRNKTYPEYLILAGGYSLLTCRMKDKQKVRKYRKQLTNQKEVNRCL